MHTRKITSAPDESEWKPDGISDLSILNVSFGGCQEVNGEVVCGRSMKAPPRVVREAGVEHCLNDRKEP